MWEEMCQYSVVEEESFKDNCVIVWACCAVPTHMVTGAAAVCSDFCPQTISLELAGPGWALGGGGCLRISVLSRAGRYGTEGGASSLFLGTSEEKDDAALGGAVRTRRWRGRGSCSVGSQVFFL